MVGLKYLLWLQRLRMEMVRIPVKNSQFWSPQKRPEITSGVLKNIRIVDGPLAALWAVITPPPSPHLSM